MKLSLLISRSLRHFWRTNVAVALGAAVGTAVLCGALLVGDSMRASLREAALGRLGRIDYAAQSPRFFRSKLADELADPSEDLQTAPLVTVRGAATHADTQARAGGINVYGVDARYWQFANDQALNNYGGPTAGEVVLTDRLASEIDAAVGDDVILRVNKPGDVSLETLLGRRDDATAGLRLRVARIVSSLGVGGYSANPGERAAKNAFVSIHALQQTLDREDQVNAIVARGGDANWPMDRVKQHVTLADYGVRMIVNESLGYVRFESAGFLVDPVSEGAIVDAAKKLGAETIPVIAYLANSIAPIGGDDVNDRTIAYSTIAAVDPRATGLTLTKGRYLSSPDADEILVNQWTATQMNAAVGDAIEISYYVTGPLGDLQTERRTLTLVGVVAMDEAALDQGFTPEYEGVTDTRTIADWDPPFPMDLKRIRDRDDDYWKKYRTAPKAFVGSQTGLSMWAEPEPRLGRFTSIRVKPDDGADVDAFAEKIKSEVLRLIDPSQFGLVFQPVRSVALAAGQGSTNFGMLFIGFSFFLIASAAMLVALLFRLAVERRSREVGMMLATGYSPRRAFRCFAAQGVVLAGIGGFVGIAGAIGYAALMIRGLTSWWSDAVTAPLLHLSITPASIAIGYLSGLVVACISIGWSIRGLTKRAPAALLAGATGADNRQSATKRRTWTGVIAIGLAAAAIGLAIYGSQLSGIAQAGTFFGGGFCMLTAGLCGVYLLFARRRHRQSTEALTRQSMWRLAARNVPRHAGRGVLTVGLIAAATFLLVAVEAFRLDAGQLGGGKDSGAGGFTLLAESAGPLPYDPGDADGRSSLGFRDANDPVLADVTIFPFRLRRGDQTSCLNLYMPENPRIVGAPPAFVDRGGFQFASSLADSDAERDNPWRLLDESQPGGAIPVIGDEAAVMWQLHSGLGKELVIADQRGESVRLRFVGLLRNSVLQDELVVSDADFVRMFPNVDGHSFFLIQTPPDATNSVERTLEQELSTYGFDATRSDRKIADFLGVQNTYLSTFQTLGGIGLVLGSIGLAAVLLRNIWERRGELALMRALGFAQSALAWMVVAENLILVLLGLGVGVGCAIIAVLPSVLRDPSSLPLKSLGITLAAVVIVGGGASIVAIRGAIRAPLITSLRRE